eukprot:m51a1_g1371 hypothetical protein (358) ;mRNA; r:423192-424628
MSAQPAVALCRVVCGLPARWYLEDTCGVGARHAHPARTFADWLRTTALKARHIACSADKSCSVRWLSKLSAVVLLSSEEHVAELDRQYTHSFAGQDVPSCLVHCALDTAQQQPVCSPDDLQRARLDPHLSQGDWSVMRYVVEHQPELRSKWILGPWRAHDRELLGRGDTFFFTAAGIALYRQAKDCPGAVDVLLGLERQSRGPSQLTFIGGNVSVPDKETVWQAALRESHEEAFGALQFAADGVEELHEADFGEQQDKAAPEGAFSLPYPFRRSPNGSLTYWLRVQGDEVDVDAVNAKLAGDKKQELERIEWVRLPRKMAELRDPNRWSSNLYDNLETACSYLEARLAPLRSAPDTK